MTDLEVFVRTVRSRSVEHQKAMEVLYHARLVGQMVSTLRQELDSLVRVIYLLDQPQERQDALIRASVEGKRWTQPGIGARVTDRQMVDLANKLHGWTESVYRLGCGFIHLSHLHAYNDGDLLAQLPADERDAILGHVRHYHHGPPGPSPTFDDLVPFLPDVLRKVSSNLEHYVERLERGDGLDEE